MVGKNRDVIRRGAIAVIFEEGRYLVIERSQNVAAPGMFCFPGGTIEAGESSQAAVVREAREELGIRVEPVQLLWTSRTTNQVELDWWEVSRDNSEILPNPEEVRQYLWLSQKELLKLDRLLASNLAFLAFMDKQNRLT